VKLIDVVAFIAIALNAIALAILVDAFLKAMQ
jgi:hypothetical protein